MALAQKVDAVVAIGVSSALYPSILHAPPSSLSTSLCIVIFLSIDYLNLCVLLPTVNVD